MPYTVMCLQADRSHLFPTGRYFYVRKGEKLCESKALEQTVVQALMGHGTLSWEIWFRMSLKKNKSEPRTFI